MVKNRVDFLSNWLIFIHKHYDEFCRCHAFPRLRLGNESPQRAQHGSPAEGGVEEGTVASFWASKGVVFGQVVGYLLDVFGSSKLFSFGETDLSSDFCRCQ